MASTIQDIAKYCGLSLGTVSKYINGIPVKEVNRLKIEKAIEELDYKPNYLAKSLRTARTHTIAVLVPKLANIHCTILIAAIENYLLPKGYCVIVSECHEDSEMEVKKTEFLLNRLIDGIIILPFCMDGRIIEMTTSKKIPLVLIDQTIVKHPVDSVILDNAESTYVATKKLIEMGHRKIAVLTGNPNNFTAKGRLNGYKQALSEFGIPITPDYIADGNYTMDGGYAAFRQLYEHGHLPPAIICTNYDMTVGMYRAINELHIKVPDDLSVIGYDNLPLCSVVSPPLSIIEQPLEDMAHEAAALLYRRIQGDYSDYPQVIVNHATLHLKESVRTI